MRTLAISLMATALAVASFAGPGGGHGGGYSSGHGKGRGSKAAKTKVTGYTKKNGKHVNSYDRTTPDATQANNWSASGNVNPETNKVGTKPVQH